MKQIPVGKDQAFALVDDEDFELVSQYKWYPDSKSSATTYATSPAHSEDGKPRGPVLRMHRLIMNAPKGVLVDHKDGNGLNNCRSNLRLCNKGQNRANASVQRNNRLGLKGVTKKRKRFYAQITVNWELFVTGSFATPEEAAKAYDQMAIERFGEFAKTNYPKELYQNPEFAPKARKVWSVKTKPKKRVRKSAGLEILAEQLGQGVAA